MNNRPKVAAVIQARMGSSRLPRKVLLDLAGKPVLWHVIHRLRKCRTLDVIAIATSDRPCDDALAEFAQREGVELVRGSEENVLQRFAKAAKQLDADVILRVTGDAPLLDPWMADRLIEALLQEKAEYCTGQEGVPSIHEGFCPFQRSALNRLLAEAADDPVAKEHVSAYFVAHPEKFRIARVAIPPEHQIQSARVSIDTPSDVRFLEEVYKRLNVPAGEAEVIDVVNLLRAHPGMLETNKHVYQKKATDKSYRAMICCDGDAAIGMGHVVRCLALGDELREKHGVGITFAMSTGEPGMALVRKNGFPIAARPTDATGWNWLDERLEQQHPDMILLDIRNDLPRTQVRDWRRKGILVATLDDPSDRRLEADLAFYPPVPQVEALGWQDFNGEIFVGWDWVILRSVFAQATKGSHTGCPHIVVTMGGSDPAGMTMATVRALDRITDKDFKTTVVIGPAFAHKAELNELLRDCRRQFLVRRNVTEMADLMSQADLCIASFGVTAYELAAIGVPSLLFCLTDDHALSASVFDDAGMSISLGRFDRFSKDTFPSAFLTLLDKPEKLEAMSVQGKMRIDGLGAARVAKALINRLALKTMP